ncbi:hypothetical protein A9Q84_16695 [Halobacteriovorax marinus]|uniref:Uncharacterized protein n=1 Tax=Halobacteriovorax marinus TaxID=97084 RepID=A0A1Y5F8F5_9BACT|nr:hypothetical protein A9Q84_16695 [Halobacteriovorax marinus]
MKLITRSILILCLFNISVVASESTNLVLRAIVRANVNVYFEEGSSLRVLSNAPFKKSIRPFKYSSGTFKKSADHKDYKVLEISMN